MIFRTVIITTPELSPYDAVSNDVRGEQRLLEEQGMSVFLFAEFIKGEKPASLLSQTLMKQLIQDPEVVWIYHHCVYWALGEELWKSARCRKVLKYHNITPKKFFQDFGDWVGAHATERGISQTKILIEGAHNGIFLSDSEFNEQDLLRLGVSPQHSFVTPPLTEDLKSWVDSPDDPDALPHLKTGLTHLLFVGRIVPNKGIHHLIGVLSSFVKKYGDHIRLHIVGGRHHSPPAYLRLLDQRAEQEGVAHLIRLHGSKSMSFLATMYRRCDVFLLMSEHEGFCVPIIEAQTFGLPVVALNRGAVGETLGKNQCVIDELDFGRFSDAINQIKSNEKFRNDLRDHGTANVQFYADSNQNQSYLIQALENQKSPIRL